MKRGLIHGPLDSAAVHLCVDMQRLFGPESPWEIPWLVRVIPRVEALCAHSPGATIFTRFVPPKRPEDADGQWQAYYRRWEGVTLDVIGPDAVRLVPELERFVPPGRVVDKKVYSPWEEDTLDHSLQAGVSAIVISGGETDVCVLATVLGSIDRGYRTILAADALCSSFDDTHDDLMDLYFKRFSLQLEVADTDEILGNWKAG